MLPGIIMLWHDAVGVPVFRRRVSWEKRNIKTSVILGLQQRMSVSTYIHSGCVLPWRTILVSWPKTNMGICARWGCQRTASTFEIVNAVWIPHVLLTRRSFQNPTLLSKKREKAGCCGLISEPATGSQETFTPSVSGRRSATPGQPFLIVSLQFSPMHSAFWVSLSLKSTSFPVLKCTMLYLYFQSVKSFEGGQNTEAQWKN